MDTQPPTEQRIREIVREEIEWALKLAKPVQAAPRTPRPPRIGITPAVARRNARFAELVASYQSGLSIEKVALKHGASPPTVSKALRAFGIAARKGDNARKGYVDQERLQRIIDLRSEGATLETIAAEFHITRERVRQIMTAAGVDTSDRPPSPEERAAVEAYVAGETLEAAATRLGVGESTFKKLVTRCGHTPRRRDRGKAAEVNQRALRVAQLKAAGKTVREIAEIMEFPHYERVYWHLNRAKGLQAATETNMEQAA